MIIDRNDLQPYELDWCEFAFGRTENMYETFVCTVELALKQLYTYLANGVNLEKKISLFNVYTDYQSK